MLGLEVDGLGLEVDGLGLEVDGDLGGANLALRPPLCSRPPCHRRRASAGYGELAVAEVFRSPRYAQGCGLKARDTAPRPHRRPRADQAFTALTTPLFHDV